MKKRSKTSRGLFLSYALAEGFFFLSSAVLLLVFCAIASSVYDPDSVTIPLSLCALYVSSAVCGTASVKLTDGGVISGVISGAITAALLFALSALPFPDSGMSVGRAVIFTLLVIPATALGAFLGKKRQRKPKRICRRT